VWAPAQRAVIFAIVLGLIGSLTARAIRHRNYVSTPQPPDGLRAAELADKFDPNTATIAEIAAIPNVGDKLATTIIEYRDSFMRLHPGQRAFEKPSDLMRVRGVGPARMEALSAHLVFPATQPTTRNEVH
jgi:DNA uptake protein ComE-like DNA-binding protein